MSTNPGARIFLEGLRSAEVIFPGLSGVTGFLEEIYRCCKDMKESDALCVEVNEHLERLTKRILKLTDEGAASEETITRFFNIVFNYHEFLVEYTRKSKVDRFFRSDKVKETATKYYTEVDKLLQDLALDNVEEVSAFHQAWKAAEARYEVQLREQNCKLEIIVQDTEAIRNAMDDILATSESAQRTILYIYKYESKKHSSAERALLNQVAIEIKKTHGRDRIKRPPSWYIPREDVMIEKRGGFLGAGSYGEVYKGNWNFKDSSVVIKQLFQDSKLTQRSLLKEAYKWRKIHHHENVLKLLGVCDVGKPLFFVCEYASNGNFSEYFSKAGKEGMIFRLFRGAANGLNHLHSNGVVHGDLKGSNILVSDDETVKISDFGYSHIKNEAISVSRQPSGNSVRWKSPELLSEKGVADNVPLESDIFSLGMCFYEVIAQEVPWNELMEHDICKLILAHELPPRPANIIDDVWELIKGMCDPYACKRLGLSRVIKILDELETRQLKGKIQVARISHSNPSEAKLKHTISIASVEGSWSSENVLANPIRVVECDRSIDSTIEAASLFRESDYQSSTSNVELKPFDLEVKLFRASNLPSSRAYVRIEVERVAYVSSVIDHLTSDPSWDGKDLIDTFTFEIEDNHYDTINVQVYDAREVSDEKLAQVNITPEEYLTKAKETDFTVPLSLMEEWMEQRVLASTLDCTISLRVSLVTRGDSGMFVDEDEESKAEGDSDMLVVDEHSEARDSTTNNRYTW